MNALTSPEPAHVAASVAPPIMQADSLYRFFRAGDEQVQALRGVTLALSPGELVAVVGPSGSGKSTLLACLGGLDEPDGGTVRVAGQRITSQPEPARARLRALHIGFVYQDRNLFAHLTVQQNIELTQRIADRAGPSHPGVLLASLGMTERARAYPDELSGGELVRAGVAVALANDPGIVLADEPTGELDTASEAAVLANLRDRAATGTAILIASHSPTVAAAADRVITLDDGQLVP